MSSESMMAKLKAKISLINLSEAYKKCFTDPSTGELSRHGAIVLKDLSRFAKLTKSPLQIGRVTRAVDTHATCVAIGRAEPIARMWRCIKMDPYKHPLMMKDDDDE